MIGLQKSASFLSSHRHRTQSFYEGMKFGNQKKTNKSYVDACFNPSEFLKQGNSKKYENISNLMMGLLTPISHPTLPKDYHK